MRPLSVKSVPILIVFLPFSSNTCADTSICGMIIKRPVAAMAASVTDAILYDVFTTFVK